MNVDDIVVFFMFRGVYYDNLKILSAVEMRKLVLKRTRN